ncbi:MAG TPA: 3-phosphoshikimate 1-carboxyvinyltransferase [bacterium]|nr:3-phosphoshikimate 1-carboxyvinyltransferase [bacterium]HPO07053.1 3-phosphoshikimate 1-carboxyvinyltransferase [bacterium]HQO33589.1 3-phosphoshikimate 1-carboxyvinyltransferase [bacterium]HQQ01098.1 3-phosphoshikimate 1-carboxyvinyltransferase [bacterium]
MKWIVEPSRISGIVQIPGSKSHTIRAVVIASLAEGRSEIFHPLDSLDTRSAVSACQALGARITCSENCWSVEGTAGAPSVPDNVIDVGNSGTTLRTTLGIAALAEGYSVFTGDAQIRSRPIGALVRSLCDLGAHAFTTRGGETAPVVVGGRMQGGETSIECRTSQYLTSLLINCPIAEIPSTIHVPLLNEKPYVEMTLWWLDRCGIRVEREEFDHFAIPGGQRYPAFSLTIPADFSSATFFLVAAAITGGPVTLQGLDMSDTQGDKAVIAMLKEMGAQVRHHEGGVTIEGGNLEGREFDLNATPDALPAMAVAGACATGETRLVNVPQARLKETDRIRVMYEELTKMGARVEELPDGLVIHGSALHGAVVDGRHDHRVVMALSVAGLAAKGATEIETAESAAVTFPNYLELMQTLGARVSPSDIRQV